MSQNREFNVQSAKAPESIPCELIQDLFPLYIDNLTSEESRRIIARHIESCPACSAKYKNLTAEITEKNQARQVEEEKEIDYLKKVKKDSLKKYITGFFSTLIILALIVGLKIYVIGWDAQGGAVYGIGVHSDTVQIFGNVKDGHGFKNYKIKNLKDGSRKLVVYECKKSPLYPRQDFIISIPLEDIDKELIFENNTFKQNGTWISSQANELYQNKHPYIGDMPANAKISDILGIANLGDFENELQTETEPYQWNLKFDNLMVSEEKLNKSMTAYACIMLSAIENADEISWSYPINFETDRTLKKINRRDAVKILGNDPAFFAESPEKFQLLLDKVHEYLI